MTTQTADISNWLGHPGFNAGNGSNRLMVGYLSNFGGTAYAGPHRSVISFPLDFTGASGPLTAGNLLIYVRGKLGCYGNGSNPKFWVEQIDDGVTVNPNTPTDCELSGSGASTAKWGAHNNPITSTRTKYEGTPSAGDLLTINILSMLEAARQANLTRLTIRLIAADTGTGYDESNTARTINLQSHQVSGKEPQLSYTYPTNTAPNAPTNLDPATAESGETITNPGTSVTLNGTFDDPDTGDKMKSVQTQIYDGSVTQAQVDAGSVNPLTGQDKTTNYSSPYPSVFAISHTGLTGNDLYAWRARTKDVNGPTWGAWSSIQYFRTNAVPGAVQNLQVDTDTLTPDFSGLLSDSDPSAVIGAVWLQVIRDNADGSTTQMLPETRYTGAGISGGTSFVVGYSGAALSWNTQYRANCRMEDAYGDIGPLLGTWKYWTPVEVFGPDNMTPRTTTSKQNTRTPTLTIAHSSNFTNDEFEVAPNADGTGTLLWDKAPEGSDYSSAASKQYSSWPTLQPAWGQTVYWRAKVKLASTTNWTEWSPWFPFYVNALPDTPTLELPVDAGTITLSTLTAAVAPTKSPLLFSDFLDPDRDVYGEVAAMRDLEIRKASDDSLLIALIRVIDAASEYTFDPREIVTFDKSSDWTAGTSATLTTSSTKVNGAASLKVSVSALAQSTSSIQTGPELAIGSYGAYTKYTDLSALTTLKVNTRVSPLPTSPWNMYVRVYFSGNDSNYALFAVAPSAADSWEEKTLTLASPTSTGGTVDWSEVHRIDVSVYNGASGGTMTADAWFDFLYADPLFEFAGERLQSFDTLGSTWVEGAHATASLDTSDRQQGAGALKIDVASLSGSAEQLIRLPVGMKLDDYPSDVALALQTKISTLTGVTSLRLRFSSASDGASNYAEFDVLPSSADAWETLSGVRNSPDATSGSVDWSDIRSVALVMVVSGTWTGTIRIDDLTMGTVGEQMKVRVRYADQNTDGEWGPWSNGGSYGLLKIGVPPELDGPGTYGQTSIDDTNPHPTIDWRFGSPKPQAKMQVTINQVVGSDRQQVYDTGLVSTSTEQIEVPAETLDDGLTYEAVIYAEDADGLDGEVTTSQWTTSFTVPSTLTNLSVDFDTSSTVAALSVDQSGLSADEFLEYRWYRQIGQGATELIGTGTELTDPTFDDEDAWANDLIRYSVTAYNGWAESTPVTAELVITVDGWYLRVPSDRTVRLRYVVPTTDQNQPARMSEKQPLGRSDPIVHSGVTVGYRGEFTVQLTSDRFSDLASILSAAEDSRGSYIVLKTGYGESRRVKVQTIGETYGSAGKVTLRVPWVAVRG